MKILLWMKKGEDVMYDIPIIRLTLVLLAVTTFAVLWGIIQYYMKKEWSSPEEQKTYIKKISTPPPPPPPSPKVWVCEYCDTINKDPTVRYCEACGKAKK